MENQEIATRYCSVCWQEIPLYTRYYYCEHCQQGYCSECQMPPDEGGWACPDKDCHGFPVYD